jgi:predicted DNA-binding transcriptional regulator
MKFIEDTLGINVTAKPWNGKALLPFYLNDAYAMRKGALDSTTCLFIKPRGSLDTIPAIKKHIAKIGEINTLPVVLELECISAKQRKALVGARIPFVVNGSQIYLPFMGVYLQEKYTQRKLPNQTLMPSAQMLLFHYLYQNKAEMRTCEASKKLGVSAMQISRAIKQLQGLGLVSVKKDGVQNVIVSADSRLALFEKAQPHLLDPVRRKNYVDTVLLPDGLPLAGMSALSELTMVNTPAVKTVAFCGTRDELTGSDVLVDSETQTQVEIWHYTPTQLSQHPGIVDPLSLIASLYTNENERVEQAAGELLTRILG